MSTVGIFRPRMAQTGFFSSETSETGFSFSGTAQTGFFSRHNCLLAFLRLRRVFGFTSPVTSKLSFLRTARRYYKNSKAIISNLIRIIRASVQEKIEPRERERYLHKKNPREREIPIQKESERKREIPTQKEELACQKRETERKRVADFKNREIIS